MKNIYLTLTLFSEIRKKRTRNYFVFHLIRRHRITRRDIDNTHKVNGIS